jgi:putative pyrroloquinoline-quinone binding quinoprotein/putative pyrroloquinoline-quinone-binding quinoprotein
VSRLLEAPPHGRPPSHRRRPRYGYRRLLVVLAAFILAAVVWRLGVVDSLLGGSNRSESAGSVPPGSKASPGGGRASTQAPAGSSSSAPPITAVTPGPINTVYPGLSTFRGNASRSYYGEGPVPRDPHVVWRYPSTGGLCSRSNNLGQTKVWCGTGWTGQPNVIAGKDGSVEIRIGAYDGHYHFLEGDTGEPVRPDLVTSDLAKGSATSDPDGFPLYYAGSRDNFFRVVALDRAKPTVLWQINAHAVPKRVWNDDWDGAALVVGDYLLEGGENSWFYVVRLNRHYDRNGLVQVNPKIVMRVPGWDQRQLGDLGDEDVSIENSVAFRNGVAYFANSGGLVQGWDIKDILRGGTKYRRVFRFWNGDETDASIVIDQEGYLYVARHVSFNVQSRPQKRDHQVGSLMKLDPGRSKDPIVWDVQIGGFYPDGGILSTPALYKGTVYVMDTAGALVAVDQQTGRVRWRRSLPGPTWMSPVPIDDQILVGDCNGYLHNFDISNPSKKPKELWRLKLGGCVESTPAVWRGMIWVGTRDGGIYAIGDSK